MSALTPHIRVLRAEASALTAEAGRAVEAAQVAINAGKVAAATVESTVSTILLRMSEAKLHAASQLEDEEGALAESVRPKSGDVKYNPKGKP